MKDDEIAKKLLLNETCDICCFRVEDKCKKEVPFLQLPKERTCNYFWAWEDEK